LRKSKSTIWRFPATTDPVKVAEKAGEDDPERMTVIFSTYQSIVTLTRAQEAGLPEFDSDHLR
jgi:predicted helicase